MLITLCQYGMLLTQADSDDLPMDYIVAFYLVPAIRNRHVSTFGP